MSRSASVSSFIAASGSRRKSSRASRWMSEFRKRLMRRPLALFSRSKTYLLKERHRHRSRHRQVIAVVDLLRALVERAAHDEPHDHFGALVAAQTHVVLDRHVRQALGIAVDELEELAVPLLVVE